MIRILHGADLHLDSPFGAFASSEGAKYRALQRQLPGKLVELANSRECQLLLLCGDVFDSEEVHPETVQALHDALMGFAGHVFIAPGNHDPYTELSVWAQCTWPENVHIFTKEQECVMLEDLGCCVHGGAFVTQECFAALPQVQKSGYLQIGVFHGDCTSKSTYRPIEQQTIADSGFDYLALGHVHKRKMPERMANTWYGWPGVTMGRGFDELGECGALVVQLEKGGCMAEFVPVENPTYEIITVPPQMEPRVPKNSENCHCRMRFVGQRQPIDEDQIRRSYEDKFLSLQIVDESEPLPDLWEACGDGTLRGLALDALREHEDPELAVFAAQYLLSALEGREAP